MTDSSGWWAQKMGQPVQQRQPLYAPQQPYQLPQAPLYGQPPQAPQGVPQAPYGQPQQVSGSEKLNNVPFSQMLAMANAGQVAMAGGEAARTQKVPCSNCGSVNFFSVGQTAPRCFDCGNIENPRFYRQDPDAPQMRQ